MGTRLPKVGPAMKGWLTEVIRKESDFDPSDGATMDISPGAFGHNSLGANDGKGWKVNPVTGKPYSAPGRAARRLRPRHGRVLGGRPQLRDAPRPLERPRQLRRRFARDSRGASSASGAPLDPLAWDVHVYFALNGALHDAAIAAWGNKRRYVTSRPISLIRWMGEKGQSSDPKGPSYDPDGLPLVPGLIEVITKESSAPGQRHERLAPYVGQIAVRGWLGEPGNRKEQNSGVAWIRAVEWIPYQRRNFVTPAFPGFPSGHSTSSRAGAEALTMPHREPVLSRRVRRVRRPSIQVPPVRNGTGARGAPSVGRVLGRVGPGRSVAPVGRDSHRAGRFRRAEDGVPRRARRGGACIKVFRRDCEVEGLRPRRPL